MREYITAQSMADAENNLVAMLVASNDQSAVRRICSELAPRDFLTEAFGSALSVAQGLVAEGKGVDLITITEQHPELSVPVLDAMQHYLYNRDRIDDYIAIVLNASRKRRLIRGLNKLQNMAVEENSDIDDLLPLLAKLQTALAGRDNTVDDSLPAIVMEEYGRIENRSQGLEQRTVTGIDALDDATGGAVAGEMWVIAARPSVGKTALTMQIALSAALKGKKGLFFSLEMSRSMLAQRYYAMQGLESYKTRTGQLTADDWEQAAAIMARSKAFADLHFDTNARTVSRMRSRALDMSANGGLDLLMMDYMQIALPDDSGRRYGNRNLEVSQISADLKRLAKEMDVPVIALSQLTRKMDDNDAPKLSDLRDSGAIEQDADVVLALHRMEMSDDPETQDLIDLGKSLGHQFIRCFILKNRQGAVGAIDLFFIPRECRFVQALTKVKGIEQIQLEKGA